MHDLRSPFKKDFTSTHARDLAGVLKAVASPQRLRIISLLHTGGPLGPTDLANALGLSQPTASHHLRILDAAGITRWTRGGAHCPRLLDVDALAELTLLLRPRGAR